MVFYDINLNDQPIFHNWNENIVWWKNLTFLLLLEKYLRFGGATTEMNFLFYKKHLNWKRARE